MFAGGKDRQRALAIPVVGEVVGEAEWRFSRVRSHAGDTASPGWPDAERHATASFGKDPTAVTSPKLRPAARLLRVNHPANRRLLESGDTAVRPWR